MFPHPFLSIDGPLILITCCRNSSHVFFFQYIRAVSNNRLKKKVKSEMANFDGTSDPLDRSGNVARPPSRTQDVQTEHNERYPPLNDPRALKTIRSTEKARLTRIATRISTHIKGRNSRSSLKILWNEFAHQLEVCRTSNHNYCTAKRFVSDEDHSWLNNIEENAKRVYDNVEYYIARTSRPPSAVTNPVGSPPRSSVSRLSSQNSSTGSWATISSLSHNPNADRDDKHRIMVLETKLIQLQNDQKEQVKRAVEAERLKVAADYNTANNDAVKKAQLYASQLADENERFRNELLAERKRAKSCEQQAIDKQNRLDQEQQERQRVENQLQDKIKSQEQEILKFLTHPQTKNESTDPCPPAKPKENTAHVNFKQWTATNDDSLSSTRTAESNDVSRNTRSVFRLPKIDLKPYDGDPRKWPDFIAIFRDLVHCDNTLTTTEKMAILKRSLSEDIRSGLGDSLSSPSLYHEALAELESTYGHPKIVSRAYIQSLMELPKVSNNDYKMLLKFSQTVTGSVSSLKNGGYENELKSSAMLELVLAKLPSELQSRWGKKIVKSHPACLTLQDFSPWLQAIVKAEMMAKHCQIAISNPSSNASKHGQKQGRQPESKAKHPPTINSINQKPAASLPKTKQQAANETKTLVCLLCKEDHRLAQCKQFISLSLEERANMVKQWSCCLRCLSKGHLMRDCISRKKCNVEECSASHHPLLHGAPRIFQTPQSDDRNKEPTKKNIGTHWLQEDSTTTLLFTVPIYVESNGIRFESVALLDEGSQTSLIVEKLSKKLKLKGPRLPSPLSTYHGLDPKDLVRKVSFNVLNSDTSRTFQVKTAFTVPRLQAQSAHVDWPSIKQQWSHLVDIQPINTGLKRVEVLLGRDVLRVHDVLESRYPSDGIDAPDGIKTHFGWCIAGPVPTELIKFNPNINSISIQRQQADQLLHDFVTQFWLTESFGIRPVLTPVLSHEDKAALKILDKTTRHNGERYEVGLMLRDPQLTLPENKEVALRHFKSLERRFKRDQGFFLVIC